ncbi:unnamed protein product [Parnassius apollo]|uniref:(apollo) hypothetical protein n=1 Tax=Parnassius apollo TaxID=110799 RepID=A0A8S3YDD0_PARAO|nr:unnamed protein product [Parnassius apollo]
MSEPNYGFSYAESSPVLGGNKIHSEVRDEDVVVSYYSPAIPYGTIRFVEYNADPVSDFNADVKRVGQFSHPQQTLTPVITKAVASADISQASMLAPETISSHIDYSGLGGY